MTPPVPVLESHALPGLTPRESGRVRLRAEAGRFELSVRPSPDAAWIRLHSTRPEAEAVSLVDRALAGGNLPAVVGVIGVGLGYVVDEVRRRRPDVRVVALEVVPDVQALWLSRTDMVAAVASGLIVAADDPSFELPRAAWPASSLADEPLVIVPPVVAHHWPEAVGRARRALNQFIFERRANEEARQRLSPLYLRNIVQNLPVFAGATDWSVLDGIAAGESLVLCGAGPSLDRLLPDLSVQRDRAWIVALDTSVRPLLAAGIVPDLVVSIDPTALNGRHLINLPTRQRPWLVADMSLDPRALHAFAGRVFAFRVNQADPWPWLEPLGAVPTTVKAWGSVLTSACDVLTRMRPARVAFAGVDLAYTNHQTYCRGTAFEEDWERQRVVEGLDTLDDVWRKQLRDMSVYEPDIHGVPALTAGHLIAFRNWVRSLVAASPGCSFTNVTGAGILHGDGIAQSELRAWASAAPLGGRSPEARLTAVAMRSWPAASTAIADAIDAALRADREPWTMWAERVPTVERNALERMLAHSGRSLRARQEPTSIDQASRWIDVPFDPALFFAGEPTEWRVAAHNVDTYAYQLDGKTLTLSFAIRNSRITQFPPEALYLRLPEGYLAARGAATVVWTASPGVADMGYAAIHAGECALIIRRASEQRFTIDQDSFFLSGRIIIEIQ